MIISIVIIGTDEKLLSKQTGGGNMGMPHISDHFGSVFGYDYSIHKWVYDVKFYLSVSANTIRTSLDSPLPSGCEK